VKKLKLWREDETNKVVLENTPTGAEEEENLFANPVADPRELNHQILAERKQDMSERVIYADRAFYVTLIWVIFLVALTALQMVFSFWDAGLSDAQFVTVVTTTTASVFGFWLLVGRYLHRDRDKP
jgi:hypothetical protein